jgi:hypothetical protein
VRFNEAPELRHGREYRAACAAQDVFIITWDNGVNNRLRPSITHIGRRQRRLSRMLGSDVDEGTSDRTGAKGTARGAFRGIAGVVVPR